MINLYDGILCVKESCAQWNTILSLKLMGRICIHDLQHLKCKIFSTYYWVGNAYRRAYTTWSYFNESVCVDVDLSIYFYTSVSVSNLYLSIVCEREPKEECMQSYDSS